MVDETLETQKSKQIAQVDDQSSENIQEQTKGGKNSKSAAGTNLQSIVFNQPVDHEGTQVYVKGWVGPECSLAPIVLIHDLGESGASYIDWVKALASLGHPCFVFDQRGHGRSGKILGHIDSFDEYINDLLQVVNWVSFKCKRSRPYIVSHGLASVCLIHFLAQFQSYVKGCIMLEPCLEDHSIRIQKSLIRVLGEAVPRIRIPERLTPRALMGHGKLAYTAKLTEEFLTAIDAIESHFPKIRVPAQIVFSKQNKKRISSILRGLTPEHPLSSMLEVKDVEDNLSDIHNSSQKMASLILSLIQEQEKRLEQDHSILEGHSHSPDFDQIIGPES